MPSWRAWARPSDVSAFEFAHIEAVLRIQRSGGRAGLRRPPAPRAADVAPRGGATGCSRALPRRATRKSSKAYRRALQRHHPDKLKANGLPDSMIEHAKQRTQQIIEAWELMRERRGIR